MSFRDNLPFPRGGTYFGGGTTDTTSVSAIALEGKEYIVNDDTYGMGSVTLRCVRNVAAAALEAKRLVTFASGYHGKRVDGYATTHTQLCFPVDDAYGSNTIPVNDLFYIVVHGPCLIKTSHAADASNVIGEGDLVVNATAATSGATTAGRVRLRDMSAATTLQLQGLADVIGRNLTARTTGNTNTDTLVKVHNPAW